MSNTKHTHLRNSRTLNPHPEKVTAALFSNNTFFDPCDLLQVRYEMVRAHVPPTKLKELSAEFGMSVATCVRLKRKYEEGGLQALIPRERGPKGAHKITPEMLEFARNYRKRHDKTGIRELTEMVNAHFKVSLHYTGLHRALSKKNS